MTNTGFRPLIYTPPRGNKILDKLMNNLIEYLTNDNKYKTDPLLKMSVSHYQFEAIHPFQDGNGRTGRILNLLYLIQKGLLSHPTLYLSKYIIHNKELNEAIFSQPYIKAKTVGVLSGKTSRTTITRYMEELTSANILSYQQNGREVYYLNDDLIRILKG